MSPADFPTWKRNYRVPVSGQGKDVLTQWILSVGFTFAVFGWAGSLDGEFWGTFIGRKKKNGQKTVEGRKSIRARHRDVDVITGLHLAPPTNTLATSTCLHPSGWTSCSAQAGPPFWTSTHNPRVDGKISWTWSPPAWRYLFKNILTTLSFGPKK